MLCRKCLTNSRRCFLAKQRVKYVTSYELPLTGYKIDLHIKPHLNQLLHIKAQRELFSQ